MKLVKKKKEKHQVEGLPQPAFPGNTAHDDDEEAVDTFNSTANLHIKIMDKGKD